MSSPTPTTHHVDVAFAHQHHEEDTIAEEIRPAAYARIVANLPKYAAKAMESARPVAYASEVGESFRKVFPKLVKPLYALSIAYVGGDIGIKYFHVRHKPSEYRKWFLADLSLWHLGASLLLPAIVINRYVHGLAAVLARANFGIKTIKYVPTVTALCLIPFIVHPLDHFTDLAMDMTFRKYVNYKDYDDEKSLAIMESQTKH
jgi:hypothetical protein